MVSQKSQTTDPAAHLEPCLVSSGQAEPNQAAAGMGTAVSGQEPLAAHLLPHTLPAASRQHDLQVALDVRQDVTKQETSA